MTAEAFLMKTLILTAVISLIAADAVMSEPLDKRFGPDRERGYRSSREFDGHRSEFRNRDRANFLGSQRPDNDLPVVPRQDLQASPAIGLQR
ncbi:hypothetical protein [Tardiphaga sp.]|uniref:hypothetical protein n=1 Tax=Tardiphaga sp. TaxID=1926292 RepID=UPI00352A5917